MKRNWGRVWAGLLCLALILGLSVSAFAEENTAGGAYIPLTEAEAAGAAAPAVPAQNESILDSDAITKMVEDYLAQKGIAKDRVGIGFCYTATGDEYFYHPDTWFYPGSMYKVPLMMQLSERLRTGEVSADTKIGGLDLDTVYEYILVNSNNDYAHKVRSFLGGDEVWREDAKQYARLDSYDERYMLYCYFSPRYMTQVLETLFEAPERFPKVIDNLLRAEQAHYFRLPDEMHPYSIAQKYGSYLDNEGSNWNHNAGIIYTPNPIILTVMTKNVGGAEYVIGDFAALFKNYALTLDDKLAAHKAEQERLEAERLAEEEAARLAAEQPSAQPGPQSTQQPSVQRQPQTQVQTTTPDRAARGSRALIIMLTMLLAAAVIGGIGAIVIIKERERRRYESYKRRFEAELRQEALEREQALRRAAAQAPSEPEPRDTQRRRAAAPVQRVRRPAPESRSRAARPADDEDALSRWLDDEDDE